MKKLIKSGIAALLLIVFILSSYLPALAVGQPSSYSVKYNSGEREVPCTTLEGTGAEDYYSNYTYDTFEEMSSSQLLSYLRSLMTSTHKKFSSYDDCKNMADETDCENENGKVVLLYTNVTSTAGAANSGWNREHVWPKSLGGYETSGAGSDLHHIRPTDNRVNSCRNNLKYGEVTGGTVATGGNAASGITGGNYSSTYFEPLDNAKGDVARICLYMYVRYGGESQYTCSSITTVFQNVDVLLEWCELDPVDTWEMGRNEVVEAYQGNRNVFIDYPELAWLIFDREVPSGMTTPSGEAMENSGSGSQGGTDEPECTHQSTETRNATAATCGIDGYTGDVYCLNCGDKITSGSVIPATGEHKNTEVREALSASCYTDGYSGDTYCLDCGKRISVGVVITAAGAHQWSNWEYETDGITQYRHCLDCGETQTLNVDFIISQADSDAEKILLLIALGATDSLLLDELSK